MGEGMTDVESCRASRTCSYGWRGHDGDSNTDLYVDPPGAPAVGGRIVLGDGPASIRAKEPDFSFTDSNTYQYADIADAYVPAALGGFPAHRHSRTIHLRNTRQ